MRERKVRNLILYSFYLFFYFFINNHDKQHKMQKATRCKMLLIFCVKENEQINFLLFFLFLFIFVFYFVFSFTTEVNNAKC